MSLLIQHILYLLIFQKSKENGSLEQMDILQLCHTVPQEVMNLREL